MIKENLSLVNQQVSAICHKAGVDPKGITLVGVTKYADADSIREAVEAGLLHVGENKVQEAGKKFHVLEQTPRKVTRHMIGHLQTNKVKQALGLFDLIQSVDSLKLALEIETQAGKLGRLVDILIQVNTSGEEQKYGLRETEVQPLLEKIARYSHIFVKGLMTIAPFDRSKESVRDCFARLRELKYQLIKPAESMKNVEFKYLSMGMTNDYDIAIAEGSNMIRIGRAIFQAQ